jgi:hypothetical protein
MGLSLRASGDLGQTRSERIRELKQVRERRVALSALDAADVRAVEAGSVRECFLTQATLLAQLANRSPVCKVAGRTDGHPQTVVSRRLYSHGQ